MDPNLRVAQQLVVEHRHSDGTWSPLAPLHHDSADHDGERSWLKRTVYRCTTCEETVRVTDGVDEEGGRERR